MNKKTLGQILYDTEIIVRDCIETELSFNDLSNELKDKFEFLAMAVIYQHERQKWKPIGEAEKKEFQNILVYPQLRSVCWLNETLPIGKDKFHCKAGWYFDDGLEPVEGITHFMKVIAPQESEK